MGQEFSQVDENKPAPQREWELSGSRARRETD
jgi:hypothetical protein